MAERFVTGVNYWPRRKAMYWWSDFDPAEVADEFDVISSLGMDVVRIFLLWDDWQESPDTVSPERLTDLGRVCDAAHERGLGLDVTFFTGHMSGPNWVPRWLIDQAAAPYLSPFRRQVVSGGRVVESPYRDFFADPSALEAERLLLGTVVSEYHDHPGIWMWNLGNEPDLFALPASPEAGERWVAEMTELVHEIDAIHPVTVGLHSPSLLSDNGLRVDRVFQRCDRAVIHGYPMYLPWARDPLDPDFVPFLCALVTALSSKPCLAEEWGGCTAPPGSTSCTWELEFYGEKRAQLMAGEQALADYVAATLPRLVEVGATGAMLWCFADYHESLWDRPPCDEARHERHFGLVRPDGSLKPHAEEVRKFAASRPQVSPPRRVVTLDTAPDDYYNDPEATARELYLRFQLVTENGDDEVGHLHGA